MNSVNVISERDVGYVIEMNVLQDGKKLYLYHLEGEQPVFGLIFSHLENFCCLPMHESFNNKLVSSFRFTCKVIFLRNGITNNHNNRIWTEVNPNRYAQITHQKLFLMNVWIGITGNYHFYIRSTEIAL